MNIHEIYVGPGEMFGNTVKRAIAVSKMKDQVIMFNFNGVNCHVNETSDPELVDRDYSHALRVGIEKIGPHYQQIADPVVVELARKADEKREREMAEFREQLRKAQEEMKTALTSQLDTAGIRLKNESLWNEYKEKNTDSYGARCVSFAEEWALLMQGQIPAHASVDAVEAKIAEIADKTSDTADYDGITGFMFGAAKSILINCWIHGEQLRKYYATK